jgi:hypothetical protein
MSLAAIVAKSNCALGTAKSSSSARRLADLRFATDEKPVDLKHKLKIIRRTIRRADFRARDFS